MYLYTVLGLSKIGARPEILLLDDRGGEDFPYFPVRRVGVREALDMMRSPDAPPFHQAHFAPNLWGKCLELPDPLLDP